MVNNQLIGYNKDNTSIRPICYCTTWVGQNGGCPFLEMQQCLRIWSGIWSGATVVVGVVVYMGFAMIFVSSDWKCFK